MTITIKSILSSVLTAVPQLTNVSLIPINSTSNDGAGYDAGNVGIDWLEARSIIGDYEFTVPPLNLKVDKNIYALQGCNVHTFEYTTGTDKNSAKFRIIGSTKRACDVDFDSFYLQAFALTRYLVPIDNGFRLLDENYKLIL